MDGVLKWVDRTVAACAAALVVATTLAVCLNVFYRYVLHMGLVWADEVPGFLLVWIAFLGAYLAYRENGHIAFDLLLEKLPSGASRVLASVIDLMVGALMVMIGLLSIKVMGVVGGRPIETLPIPQGVFMVIMPLSSGLILLALLARIVGRWRTAP
jgi:TRAP-type C4-dicarboxylate transport system permease small subunit